MLSVNIGKYDIEDFLALDKMIRARVPFGFNQIDKSTPEYKRNLEICKNILDNFYEIE